MFIIDSHTHIGKSKLSSIDIQEEDLLSSMRKSQIGAALVIPHALSEDPLSDHLRVKNLIEKHPNKFFGVTAFNPLQFNDYAYMTKRYIKEMGFVGIKFHPLLFSLSPLMEQANIVFALANDLGVPVIVHTGTGAPWSLPSLCIPVAQRYPDLKIILAHCGMMVFAEEAFVAAKVCPNIYLEISWSMGYQIKHFLSVLGQDRFMFGSDLPDNLENELVKVKSLNFNKTELTWILGKTADNVFKLGLVK